MTTTWGNGELEPEVEGWLEALSPEEFGHVAFYVDLLERQGTLLGEPYTRQIGGKLRELRFYRGTATGADLVLHRLGAQDRTSHGVSQDAGARAGGDQTGPRRDAAVCGRGPHGGGLT